MLKDVRNRAKSSKKRDPEGRMSLGDHLRELRNRLGIALGATLAVTIVALFFSRDLMAAITEVLPTCVDEAEAMERDGRCAVLTYQGVISPFSTFIQVAFMAGVVVASPVWIYQLWAFVAPGLHRNEKRYSTSVVAVGVPLFLVGAYFARWVLPRAIPIMLGFSQDEAENLVTVPELIDITVRLVIAFGLAFQLPLILVLLNFGGAVSGRRMLGWWRGMVMGIALFAAAFTPTDPMSMIALALPVTLLYFLATGIALLNDYRRERRNPDTALSDDQASDLDLTPSPVGESEEGIGRQRRGSDGDEQSPRNGYDDAT